MNLIRRATTSIMSAEIGTLLSFNCITWYQVHVIRYYLFELPFLHTVIPGNS